MFKPNWIWIPEWRGKDKEEPRIIYFRKEIELQEIPSKLEIKISADSRYKLYINGNLAEIGPSKGDYKIWYCDTVDIAPFLVEGINGIAVVVLRYPMELLKGNSSIFRTQTPGLYIVGNYIDQNGEEVDLSTNERWKCMVETNVQILPEQEGVAPLYFFENATTIANVFGWMKAGYDDANWLCAKPIFWEMFVNQAASPGNLHDRTIPYMKRIPRKFSGITTIRQSCWKEEDWNRMLIGNESITVPANSTEVVEINAGELMTGFLKLALAGGKGTKIKIIQSESYVIDENQGDKNNVKYRKQDRTDYSNGHLVGWEDHYEVAGLGYNKNPEYYEPFWFRTFRFIGLEIITSTEPLMIQSFDYQETGYPLEVRTWVETSDESFKDIWDISERSLRRCMHETYEDCPFYEQQQYAMDTRAEILYTYMVAADDRLARKSFDDFRRSQRYDGMINCSYPSYSSNIIPGFSIYYILMLYDHMMYFGDKELIRSYLSSIDGVLEFFHRHLTRENLVDKIGGRCFQGESWSFIDWNAHWNEFSGIPPASLVGPITMESMLYIMGLEHAAEMMLFAGRASVAVEYRKRAQNVREAIRKYCIGSNHMVQDGPGVEEYSQHCQVFSILTDIVSIETGKENLQKTLDNKQDYAQCSVAMSYYLFRALEKTDLYDYTDKVWDIWRDMIKNHLTTCVEEPVEQRSDCHAWGALALYELPAVILGVRPTKPGFKEMEIKPIAGHLTWAKGEVITPRGMVKVQWRKVGGNIKLEYQVQ